jgi:predicted Fe-S protein YdhL (DUF1289 family)
MNPALPADRDNQDEPDTPCVGVCSTGFDDVCRGCLRTAVEVGRWVEMSPNEKRAVWTRILSAGYTPRSSG